MVEFFSQRARDIHIISMKDVAKNWILELAFICRKLKYAIVSEDSKRLRGMRQNLSRVHVTIFNVFARVPCVNTQAGGDQGGSPPRPNTSVDALNTAIILCLVGTVGGLKRPEWSAANHLR